MANPLGVAFSPMGGEGDEDRLAELLSRMVGVGKPNIKRLPRPIIRGGLIPDEIWNLIMRGGGIERPDIPEVVEETQPELPGFGPEPGVPDVGMPDEPVEEGPLAPLPEEGEDIVPQPEEAVPGPDEGRDAEPSPGYDIPDDGGGYDGGGPFEDVPDDYDPTDDIDGGGDEGGGPFSDVPGPQDDRPSGPFEDVPGSPTSGSEATEPSIEDIIQDIINQIERGGRSQL